MHRTPVRPQRILFAVWLPLLALGVVLATTPDASQYSLDSSAHQGTDPVGSAAMRVQLDSESGTLIPALDYATKAPELELMLSRSDDGLVEETLPNGTVRVDLQGRFQSASVAHIDQDGEVHTRCSDQLHEVEGHLAGCSHATSQSDWEVK